MPCESTSRDGVDVARQARDDPARLLLREVAERQPGQMVEEVAAQAEHDPLADAGEPADQQRLQHPARGGDDEVDRRRRPSGSAGRAATMPLSIAFRTSSQPPVWQAALPAATSTISAATDPSPTTMPGRMSPAARCAAARFSVSCSRQAEASRAVAALFTSQIPRGSGSRRPRERALRARHFSASLVRFIANVPCQLPSAA